MPSLASATIATSTGWKRSITPGSASRWIRRPGIDRPLATLLPNWNRVPIASTTSASAITGSSTLRSPWGPSASGWSSAIAPRPSTEVSTGAPSRSASAVSSADAPAETTPPPAHRSGRLAAASSSTARSSGAWAGACTMGGCGAPTRTSPVAYCRSIGTSMAPGCGRPLVMSRAASSTVDAIAAWWLTWATYRQTVRSMSIWRSASCSVDRPLPYELVSTWPVSSSTREEAKCASNSPPIALAVPGPVLASATPMPPVALA